MEVLRNSAPPNHLDVIDAGIDQDSVDECELDPQQYHDYIEKVIGSTEERGRASELRLIGLLESNLFPFVNYVTEMPACHPGYDMKVHIRAGHPIQKIIKGEILLVDSKSSLSGMKSYMYARQKKYKDQEKWRSKKTMLLNGGPSATDEQIQAEFVFQLLVFADVYEDEDRWEEVLTYLPPQMVESFYQYLLEGLMESLVPLFMWDSNQRVMQ